MTEVKSKKVTFDESLPRGTVATFTHEGQLWFAYPQPKVQAMQAVTDRILGLVGKIRNDLVQWINSHPEDANRVILILARTNRAQELAREKAQAWVMQEIPGPEAPEAPGSTRASDVPGKTSETG